MDLLKAMRLYCRIVETGQLSRAADNVNLSKGAVSKQLSSLELHLGGRLLNRTTRRLTPTEAGTVFYERAKLILESVEEAECVVTGLTAEPRGTLKISAPMSLSFGEHSLGKLLAKYQLKYPQVEIKIDLHDRQVDVVEEGYDLVLRIAVLSDSSLIVRRLASCRLVSCASISYLEKYGEPKTPEDLKNHSCLLYAYDDSSKQWSFENAQGDKKQITVSGPLFANNGNLICDAMINGMGIVWLPEFIVKDTLESGSAKKILTDWTYNSSNLSLLYPSSKHLSAKVRAFVDIAVEHFREGI